MLTNSKKTLIGILSLIWICACTSTPPPSEEESTTEVSKDITFTTSSTEALEQFNLGLQELDMSDGQSARKYFDKAITLDPDFAIAHTFRAYTANSAKEFAEHSRMAAEKAQNISKGEELLIAINQTFLKNDVEQRYQLAKELVNNYPESPRAYIAMGNVNSDKRKIEASRTNYEKALALDQNSTAAYNGLINSYIFEEPKDLNKALLNAEKLVSLRQDHPRAHILLGDVYRAQNNLEKARDAYAQALKVNPADFVAYSKKGHAETFLGNYEEARTDFNSSLEFAEYKPGVVIFKLLTYVYNGETDKAIEELKKAEADLPNLGMTEANVHSGKVQYNNAASLIAFENGKLDYLKELNAKRELLNAQTAEDLGTEEARAVQTAILSLWEANALILAGDLEGATAKANEFKTKVQNIKNENIMEGYHFTMGMIAFSDKNYPDAIEHLKQSSPFNMQHKYHLAKAYEMNNQVDAANALYNEIANYNFNDVTYAVVRGKVRIEPA